VQSGEARDQLLHPPTVSSYGKAILRMMNHRRPAILRKSSSLTPSEFPNDKTNKESTVSKMMTKFRCSRLLQPHQSTTSNSMSHNAILRGKSRSALWEKRLRQRFSPCAAVARRCEGMQFSRHQDKICRRFHSNDSAKMMLRPKGKAVCRLCLCLLQ